MAKQFRHEDIESVPRGYHVRTVTEPSGHEIRLAFPPGQRKKGAGKLISILHPRGEKNPCGLMQSLSRKNSAVRNTDELEEARELYERFTGRESGKVATLDEPMHVRDDYAQLGWVEWIVFHPTYDGLLADCPAISQTFDELVQDGESIPEAWEQVGEEFGIALRAFNVDGDEIRLASSADGRQLYFLGGQQQKFRKYLEQFGTDVTRDRVDLGELVSLTYRAKKTQLGDRRPESYYHIFAEEYGAPPKAFFDQLNNRIGLIGGDYHMREAEAGIVN